MYHLSLMIKKQKNTKNKGQDPLFVQGTLFLIYNHNLTIIQRS